MNQLQVFVVAGPGQAHRVVAGSPAEIVKVDETSGS